MSRFNLPSSTATRSDKTYGVAAAAVAFTQALLRTVDSQADDWGVRLFTTHPGVSRLRAGPCEQNGEQNALQAVKNVRRVKTV